VPPDPMPGPPSVVSVAPADAATNGDPLGVVRITFSEPLDPNTATSANIQIKDSAGAVVDGSVSYADGVVTFKSQGRLNLLSVYSVNVSAAVTDAGGTAMTRPYMSSFTVRDGIWRKAESSLPVGTGGFNLQSIIALASDGGTRAVAVWTQLPDGGTGSNFELVASFYSQGKGWATPVKVNTNAAVKCQSQSVSMNASGNVIIGWVEVDSANAAQPYSVQARRFMGGSWDAVSSRVDVASSATYVINQQGVAVAMATNNHSHVAWKSYDNNTTGTTAVTEYGAFGRHADAAGNWDGSVYPFSYMQAASGVSTPALAFDRDSNGFAAYQLQTGSPAKTNTYVFRYTTKWGSSAVASGTSDAAALPVAVATSPTGEEAVLSWARGTGTDYDLMGSSYNRAWNAPAIISTAKTAIYYQNQTQYDFPMLSAAWTGASFLVGWAQSGGTPNHVYATQLKGGIWGTATIVSDGNHNSGAPWLTGDGRGNALAVWGQASDAPATPTYTPLDVVFSRFVGSTGQWSNYKRVSSVDAGYRFPQAVTLADGTSLAVWQRLITKSVNGVLGNEFQ
ncbi:MAG TPA: Ig-like domain-containing protein, partial [Polyangiaceae bacterium]|nr:Ig-like domain-containing protein [Polyangiaceae bacterium]